MNYEIRFSNQIDLVYHIFSYIKVKNPSDIYNKAYTKEFDKLRGSKLTVPAEMVKYYNQNFQQLCSLGFMPFNYNSIEEYTAAILQSPYFSDQDKENFIKPFVELLNNEKDFYYNWWAKHYTETAEERNSLSSYMTQRFKPYENFFKKKGEKIVLYFSFSLSKNGRGINYSEGVMALSPYPTTEAKKSDAFYQLFHECTHQLTDPLLNRDISMDDGSHMLTEKMVILEDYYLINQAGVDELKTYYPVFGLSKNISPEKFEKYMEVPEEIDIKLKELLK